MAGYLPTPNGNSRTSSSFSLTHTTSTPSQSKTFKPHTPFYNSFLKQLSYNKPKFNNLRTTPSLQPTNE